MNKIVIVEDTLVRGISLAEQFVEFSRKHPELELEVSAICFFCSDSEKADADMQRYADCGFNVQRVTLSNFKETMNTYLYSEEERFFLVMDYLLEDDGSEGIPIRRVNIRYARSNNRCSTNRLWFYTGAGALHKHVLGELVGEKHRLDVSEVSNNYVRLQLENSSFINALASCNKGCYTDKIII